MRTVATGDTVQVHYTLTLDDGAVVDSSRDRGPFEVTLGRNQVIPGFEEALLGMATGDEKRFTVPAGDAYGPWRDELVRDVPRQAIPADVPIEAGQQLMATDPQGQQMLVTVLEIGDGQVKLDTNHPLAGQDLTFDLELVAIE